MRKAIILILLLLTSCQEFVEIDNNPNRVQRLSYEGHEYIMFAYSGGSAGYGGVEHNPNCKGCQMSEFDLMQLAIIMTESRFDPDARGKAEDSGMYQMRPIYVKEVNRIWGTNFTIEDAFDVNKSVEIFSLMQGHYNPNKDLDLEIYYHNKSPEYKRRVLQNYEFVRRYETARKAIRDSSL